MSKKKKIKDRSPSDKKWHSNMSNSGRFKFFSEKCVKVKKQLVDNECAPRSIWQLFHHEIPILCALSFFFPFTMHTLMYWNVHNFSSLSPIDLALFHSIHIPFIVKWHRTIWLAISKINKVQWIILFYFFCNAPDLSHFLLFLIYGTRSEPRKTSMLGRVRKWAELSITTHFFSSFFPLQHLLDNTRVLECYEKGKVFFSYSLYATESARLKFLFSVECLLV